MQFFLVFHFQLLLLLVILFCELRTAIFAVPFGSCIGPHTIYTLAHCLHHSQICYSSYSMLTICNKRSKANSSSNQIANNFRLKNRNNFSRAYVPNWGKTRSGNSSKIIQTKIAVCIERHRVLLLKYHLYIGISIIFIQTEQRTLDKVRPSNQLTFSFSSCFEL